MLLVIMMPLKSAITKQLDELDHPLPTQGGKGWFKKGKLRVIVINEDYSFREFFCRYPESYTIELKKKTYVVVPKAIIRGKFPTIMYYYNNPFPIGYDFQYSKVTALDLRDDPEQVKKMTEEQKTLLANVDIDAETINLAFNTRVMRGLYSNSFITPKFIIIVAIIFIVVVLLVLQLTGVVDVWGLLTGSAK